MEVLETRSTLKSPRIMLPMVGNEPTPIVESRLALACHRLGVHAGPARPLAARMSLPSETE